MPIKDEFLGVLRFSVVKYQNRSRAISNCSLPKDCSLFTFYWFFAGQGSSYKTREMPATITRAMITRMKITTTRSDSSCSTFIVRYL